MATLIISLTNVYHLVAGGLIPNNGSEKISRLLTKSEVRGGRGGGRKRGHGADGSRGSSGSNGGGGGGSSIHSIPKFSQVQPRGQNGQITDVQRVLQSRLLSRQRARQQQSQQLQQPQAVPSQRYANLQSGRR